MFRRIHSMKGQNTAEYAILIGVIIAAAIAMQVYVRRGMQARVKDAVDFTTTADVDSGDTFFNDSVSQYEPYYMNSELTTTQDGSSSSATLIGGGTDRATETESIQRNGTQQYTDYSVANT